MPSASTAALSSSSSSSSASSAWSSSHHSPREGDLLGRNDNDNDHAPMMTAAMRRRSSMGTGLLTSAKPMTPSLIDCAGGFSAPRASTPPSSAGAGSSVWRTAWATLLVEGFVELADAPTATDDSRASSSSSSLPEKRASLQILSRRVAVTRGQRLEFCFQRLSHRISSTASSRPSSPRIAGHIVFGGGDGTATSASAVVDGRHRRRRIDGRGGSAAMRWVRWELGAPSATSVPYARPTRCSSPPSPSSSCTAFSFPDSRLPPSCCHRITPRLPRPCSLPSSRLRRTRPPPRAAT